MTGAFELRHSDAAGRIGRLAVPGHPTPIRTPALMPVINPNINTLPAAEIAAEFDPAVFITNAYVIYRSEELRERARAVGLDGLLEVDVPIMTDSGAFQLAEYGAVEVDNDTIVRFQVEVGSDIITPLDIPTPPNTPRDRAREDLETTQRRIATARTIVDEPALLAGPAQGSTHPALRRRAGHLVDRLGADVAPIGAVVPLLEDYRFAAVVDVVVAAKRGLGPALPVHLFGAGHPMMFALAAAMGCDLFDSAAYAIYARDGRYLTSGGTLRLEELDELPCGCPVCAEHTPMELETVDAVDRERALARHNLHTSFAELRRVRQAIRAGTLLELLERRARSHPAMLEAYRRLLEHDAFLERHDASIKSTFMYVSAESAHRPAVLRHHRRLRGWIPDDDVLLAAAEDLDGDGWVIRPPFGPIPPGLDHTYPLNAELPSRPEHAAYLQAAEGIVALAHGAEEARITLRCREWPAAALDRLPSSVRLDAN